MSTLRAIGQSRSLGNSTISLLPGISWIPMFGFELWFYKECAPVSELSRRVQESRESTSVVAAISDPIDLISLWLSGLRCVFDKSGFWILMGVSTT